MKNDFPFRNAFFGMVTVKLKQLKRDFQRNKQTTTQSSHGSEIPTKKAEVRQ